MDISAVEVDAPNLSVRKVMFDSKCIHDCKYSIVRGKGCEHTPESLADSLLRADPEKGIFLSSGVTEDPDEVTLGMLRTARLLRERGFNNYLHFKVLPGVSRDLVKVASHYADRMSINIETVSSE